MRQNGRQFHESVARRKLKWQDFYYNSRISSDMQYCNKSLFYTPKQVIKCLPYKAFIFITILTLCKYFYLFKRLHSNTQKEEKEMEFLTDGILALTWQQIVMFAVGITLIWLAIKKGFEPALLLPMGFGAILVNLPFSGVLNQTLAGGIQANGVIEWLFHAGIEASEVMPILLFIGIGAMIDFGPLLSNPSLFLFGAGAQLGIFAAILLSTILGFDLKDAASIGIIGAADGPTSILVSQVLNSKYIGAIAVAAYSYMALVPIVQPFAIRLVTTKKERCIHMEYNPKSVSKTMKIAFPIIVTVIVGLVAPQSVALVGFLMFGNLIRECGVLGTLSDTAQNILANLITLLLGITIPSACVQNSL